MKHKEELKKREFLVEVPHPKGKGGVEIVWRIMLLGKRTSTKKLDHVDLILNYFQKRKVRISMRGFMVILI